MMAEYLPALLAAWGVQLVGVMSPGPSVALLLGVGTAQGARAALLTCAGIASASLVLSVATVLGLTVIFAQLAEAMVMLKLVGAAYLAWLAWGAVRRAVTLPPLPAPVATRATATRLARRGFLLQVSNPKAILFWIAIASLGGLAGAPWPVILIFVAGAFLNSFLGHAAWGLVFAAPPMRRAYLSGRRWVEGALAGFFAFASFKLLTTRI
ncbi:LysE family transporter [Dinoroseobacter sp. PD6]|uniref:LysE family translocator n=1 Tax=Dinoroseobacter sp. PD6 TaxID=3028384 RepID=UPI00237B50C6|nr:LysE family transporter [Dinoroseobacter sp. PD6]MDD9716980.1 LysE family transporter [Dinoroseobacter sp. PD6]